MTVPDVLHSCSITPSCLVYLRLSFLSIFVSLCCLCNCIAVSSCSTSSSYFPSSFESPKFAFLRVVCYVPAWSSVFHLWSSPSLLCISLNKSLDSTRQPLCLHLGPDIFFYLHNSTMHFILNMKKAAGALLHIIACKHSIEFRLNHGWWMAKNIQKYVFSSRKWRTKSANHSWRKHFWCLLMPFK